MVIIKKNEKEKEFLFMIGVSPYDNFFLLGPEVIFVNQGVGTNENNSGFGDL